MASNILENIDLKSIVSDMLEDESFQKQLLALSDGLYDRYRIKVMNTIGGFQKGINASDDVGLPDIIDKHGHISLKGLLPIAMKFLSGNQGQNQPQASNTPKELIL
jgi:hypothetical protein